MIMDKEGSSLWRGAAMLALSLCCLLASGCQHGLYVRVKTGGWVQGAWLDDEKGTVRTFLGIPYAEAPTGALRFRPPQPVMPWKGVLKTLTFSPSCVQPPGPLAAPGEQSEDCLTLNVYSPAGAKPGAKPVMVFIHGGAFVSGGSSQYDGARLAEDYGVVVVTLNYRLGALGFLSHPELDQELQAPQSGNLGLKDQQLALHWVQQNIVAFGGDPQQVTLFGESAGSASTCVHMVAPGSQDLAQQFIMESGVCIGGLPINSKTQSDAIGEALLQALCPEATDRLGCLRELPAAQCGGLG
ncbi:MAG: carboxylesterase family protein [Pseudomonadota bacterium]|nr:carboxylesterase family protein [Pseudomonadota bacterium]